MAIKALDLHKTRTFVSSQDDGDDPTIWHIGTLSSRDVGVIRDSATTISFGRDQKDGADQDIKTTVSRSKMNFEAVRRGLKKVENFLDEHGNPIDLKLVLRDVGGGVKKEVVPNEFMDRIPLSVVEELADEIMGDNMDGDEAAEAGNSPAPSTDD
jgi:hypothetical protein